MTTPIFNPQHILTSIGDWTPRLVGAKRTAPTIAVARVGLRSWLYCLHCWATSFVHVSAIGEVSGTVEDVANEIANRRLYALRVAIDTPVANASVFAPMPVHVIDLAAPKTLTLAVQKQHALFSQGIENLPLDLRLVQALLTFDGTTIEPHIALLLLVAIGYGPVEITPPARGARPIEGGWVNGRLASDQLTFGGRNPYRTAQDKAFDRQMFPQLRKDTFR